MAVWAVLLAAVAAFATAGVGQAQALDGPREQPPASFDGQQFVDSRGCVFLRAARDGKPFWVQRLTGDRQPMCGYQPTVIEQTVTQDTATPETMAGADTDLAEAGPDQTEADQTGPDKTGADTAAAAPDVADLSPELALPRLNGVGTGGTHSGKLPEAEVAVIAPCPPDAQAPRLAPISDLPVPATFSPPPGYAVAKVRVKDPGDQASTKVEKPAEAKVGKARKDKERPRDAAKAPMRGLYVQVGVYRVRANAKGAQAQMEALGLPAGQVRVGKCLRSVRAGPFESREQAAKALMAIRAAGFSDAYIRRAGS